MQLHCMPAASHAAEKHQRYPCHGMGERALCRKCSSRAGMPALTNQGRAQSTHLHVVSGIIDCQLPHKQAAALLGLRRTLPFLPVLCS